VHESTGYQIHIACDDGGGHYCVEHPSPLYPEPGLVRQLTDEARSAFEAIHDREPEHTGVCVAHVTYELEELEV
jgi:hypothetical protein